MDFKEKLKARAEKEGISLTPKQLGQFELFYKMLIETNKSMNLNGNLQTRMKLLRSILLIV